MPKSTTFGDTLPSPTKFTFLGYSTIKHSTIIGLLVEYVEKLNFLGYSTIMGPEKGLENVKRTSGWYLTPEKGFQTRKKGLQNGKKDVRMVLNSGKRISECRTPEWSGFLCRRPWRRPPSSLSNRAGGGRRGLDGSSEGLTFGVVLLGRVRVISKHSGEPENREIEYSGARVRLNLQTGRSLAISVLSQALWRTRKITKLNMQVRVSACTFKPGDIWLYLSYLKPSGEPEKSRN